MAEIRLQRVDLAVSCAAIADRLTTASDRGHDDLVALYGADLSGALSVELAGDRGSAAETPLYTSSPLGAGQDVGAPAFVSVTNPASATDLEPVAMRVEESSESLRAVLWFLGGLLTVGLIVAPLAGRELRA